MVAKLIVTAEPRMARIDVVDAWMQPKGTGYGQLTVEVTPGLYEVRADSGLGQTKSQYCSVRDGEELPVILLVPFVSAAPLPISADYSEVHARAAHSVSLNPASGAAKKCRLMVFARALRGKPIEKPLSESLELRNASRRIDAHWKKAIANEEEGWVGWCAGIDPGGYILRWRSKETVNNNEVTVNQSLWATEGFTLMVFLGCVDSTPSKDFMSILEAPLSSGFDPFNELSARNLSAMEAALAGWAGRRKYLQESSEEIQTLISEEHENPLLGIVAAHSLWLAQKPNLDLLLLLHKHFQKRFREHPDVISLESHARNQNLWSSNPPPMSRLCWPPMFAASYRMMRNSPAYVRTDSLAGRIAGHLLGGSVWLNWNSSRSNPVQNLVSIEGASPRKFKREQEESLGTWLAGAMQSIAELKYLGCVLEKRAKDPIRGPAFATEIWRKFSKSRNPVLQSLRAAIQSQFVSSWDARSIGQFRTMSLAVFARRVNIPEEIVAPQVRKVLDPLEGWPPGEWSDFFNSPKIRDWVQELVIEQASQSRFDLPKVFVAVLTWLKKKSMDVGTMNDESFASEVEFKTYLRGLVSNAVNLAQRSQLNPDLNDLDPKS